MIKGLEPHFLLFTTKSDGGEAHKQNSLRGEQDSEQVGQS